MNYDELRYEYQIMKVACPLCESLICRLSMVHHQASSKCKTISGIETHKATQSVTYCKFDETYETIGYDFYKT